MDPWARAAVLLARGPGGVDAEYRILGDGPPVMVRAVFEYEDVPMGRAGRPLAALIPTGTEIGRAQRGDTLTAPVDGFPDVLTVEQAQPGWRGWAWRLSFSRRTR